MLHLHLGPLQLLLQLLLRDGPSLRVRRELLLLLLLLLLPLLLPPGLLLLLPPGCCGGRGRLH